MPFVRRRPLLRAAAVGGGAYVAGKRAQQRQEDRSAEAYDAGAAAAAPAPAPQSGMSQQAIDQLKQLAQLKDQGVLTEEEFAAQKQKLLQGM